MPDLTLTLRAISPFAGYLAGRSEIAGVSMRARDEMGLVTVSAHRGKRPHLAERVRERFGIELPLGPCRACARDMSFIGIGPDVWLATRENGCSTLADVLASDIGDLASLADQSDGYVVLRVTGSTIAATLSRMFAIDLHPGAFPPGHIAATIVSHVDVILWRLEDDAIGAAIFEIAVPRSFASSYWHALIGSVSIG